MVREFLILLGVLLAGAVAGLFSARWAADSAVLAGAVRVGAWRAWPDAGKAGVLPHARLRHYLDGALPPSPGNRLELVADTDDDGRSLNAACAYVVRGKMPPVRFWSLALHSDAEGASARAFASVAAEDVLYEPDASLVIGVSRRPAPGNWLRAPKEGKLRLVLHLLGLSPLDRDKLLRKPPFAIERKECS